MTTPWGLPDFDAHEELRFVHDRASGLKAIIAVHSTHLGPAAGGSRFWHYARDDDGLTDALRLSRAMSYKNAMASLPFGGGKAVILADKARSKSTELLHALGNAIEAMGGRYITAEDVGMSVPDMMKIRDMTGYVAGLPVKGAAAGGDPGPHTAAGVFAGIKAAVKRQLGKFRLKGLHIAVQGAGSVAAGVAVLAAGEGANLSIADIDPVKAANLAALTGGTVVDPRDILLLEADVISPCALGSILNEESIPALRAAVVAGGANNQLATPHDGPRLHARGILYAPDYVINAGGIISVCTEYMAGSAELVRRRVDAISNRLEDVWSESAATGVDPATVADQIANRLIGRA